VRAMTILKAASLLACSFDRYHFRTNRSLESRWSQNRPNKQTRSVAAALNGSVLVARQGQICTSVDLDLLTGVERPNHVQAEFEVGR